MPILDFHAGQLLMQMMHLTPGLSYPLTSLPLVQQFTPRYLQYPFVLGSLSNTAQAGYLLWDPTDPKRLLHFFHDKCGHAQSLLPSLLVLDSKTSLVILPQSEFSDGKKILILIQDKTLEDTCQGPKAFIPTLYSHDSTELGLRIYLGHQASSLGGRCPSFLFFQCSRCL